jgi:sugar lactone lactonase YvrE
VTPQDRLRRALHGVTPDTESNPASWEQITGRAHRLRTQRRVLGSAVALIAVLALTLATLAATGAFDNDTSRSVVATPTPTSQAAHDDIVAALDHSVVVLSSEDGHIVRTLYDGLNQGGGIAVAPDGGYVYFTRGQRGCDANLPQGTGGISRIGLTGASPGDVIGGAFDPLISPDGRWLAYSFASCDAPDAQHIGVLDLSTNTRYWPLDGTGPEHAVPVAWSGDSHSLLYLNSVGHVFRIDGVPQPAGAGTDLIPGYDGSVSTATLTHNNSLLIASQQAQTFVVQHFDQVPGGIGIRFIAEGQSPTTMAFDLGDRLLLHSADGTLSVQEGTSTETTWQSGHTYPTDPRVLRHDVRGAAWIPNAASSTPTTTTTAPETTTSTTRPDPSTNTATAVGARFLAVDRDGTLLFFSKPSAHQVLRRSPDGAVLVVAGNGTPGSNGDNGPAADAQLNEPSGLALGADGTIFIADRSANRVRAVSPEGTITTVAGTGDAGSAGDGGPATKAQLDQPIAVAISGTNDLYIVDANGIRRVTDGTITTVLRAGPGTTNGLVVDGQPTALYPSAIAIDRDGNLLVADLSPKLVAKYSPDGTLLHVWNDVYVSQAGLATATDGSIVVANYGNFSIDRIVGTELTTITKFSLGSIPGLDGPFRPIGLAVAGDGTIYSSDPGGAAGTSGTLIRVTPDGTESVLTTNGDR